MLRVTRPWLGAGEEVELQDTDRVRFGLVETVFRLK